MTSARPALDLVRRTPEPAGLLNTTIDSQSRVEPHAYPRRWAALAVLSVSVLLVTVDTTKLNVALPTISAELGADTSGIQWIVEAYVLVLAALMLTAGALADRLGRQRLLVAGAIVFGGASLAAVWAGGTWGLTAARAVMGLGGALMIPATLSTIRAIFPAEQRARAIGIWTAAASLGIAAGPLVGGALVQSFSWTSVFLVNVPLAGVVVVGAIALVPDTRDPQARPIDVLGAVLSVAGLATLVLALIDGPASGWLSAHTLGLFALSAGLLAVFMFWQRRAPAPVLPLGLFADRRFSIASSALAVAYAAVTGVMFAITLYLQLVSGYSPLIAGLALLPLAAGVLLVAPVADLAVRRTSTRAVIAGGLSLATGGLVVITTLDLSSGYWPLGAALALLGIGMGIAATAATESILAATPADRAGAGAAIAESAAELGQALGIAALGSVLASSYVAAFVAPPGLPAAAVRTAQTSITAAADAASDVPGATGAQLAAAANQAFVHALGDTAWVAAAMTASGAALAVLFLPSRRGIGIDAPR